ncbi:hypothetical protein IL306_003212, partial [Fusarium sp. DS 682]
SSTSSWSSSSSEMTSILPSPFPKTSFLALARLTAFVLPGDLVLPFFAPSTGLGSGSTLSTRSTSAKERSRRPILGVTD